MGGNCSQILQCDKKPTINVPHSVENDTSGNYKPCYQDYIKHYEKHVVKVIKLQSVINGYLGYQKFRILRRKKLGSIICTPATKDKMSQIGIKVEIKGGLSDPRNLPKDGVRRHFKEVQIEAHKFYEGEWFNGHRDGIGKLKWNDGSIYYGLFEGDKARGYGKLTHSDGDVYMGHWEDDRAHGVGRYINNRGASYEGYWACDKQNSYGMEIWPRGSNFEGEYVESAKDGIGILQLEDSAYYKGQFRDNDINGIGTFYFKDGRKYEGEWKLNKMFGYGILTWPDGKHFEGFFINDKKEGFGVYFANTKVYIGYWKNSKLEGEVILVEKGIIRKSLWHDGKKVQYLANDHKIIFEKLVEPLMKQIR
jgi:hypothetical protein